MNPPAPPTAPEQGLLLKAYFGESDRFGSQPLHEAIVKTARERGLMGATVFRGPMGFGASSHLRSAKILQLSTDLPLLVEIIDSEQKIRAFLPELQKMMGGGLVCVHPVEILHYSGKSKESMN
jgi:uncharacterized protein